MPTYEYHCDACGKAFSLVLTMDEHEHKTIKCPKCGSRRIKQLVSSFVAITRRKS